MALRVVFMGTPDFSVPCLNRIAAAGHKIVAVYSQPPRKAGRGMAERLSPVHEAALKLGIDVLTPETLRDQDVQSTFHSLNADVAVVVAYGLLLPGPILQVPRFGCLNLHASKLPRWRGAAPIQRAIMHGDTVTAATVMRMEEGLDTGPICLERDVPISPQMTAGELHDQLAEVGAGAMVEALALLEKGGLRDLPQCADGVKYAGKISKAEARIDFSRPADDVRNHIHGLSPLPGAWFEASSGGGPLERIKVLRCAAVDKSGEPGTFLDDGLTVACGNGAVRLLQVQRAGKKPVPADDFLRGFPLQAGDRVAG